MAFNCFFLSCGRKCQHLLIGWRDGRIERERRGWQRGYNRGRERDSVADKKEMWQDRVATRNIESLSSGWMRVGGTCVCVSVHETEKAGGWCVSCAYVRVCVFVWVGLGECHRVSDLDATHTAHNTHKLQYRVSLSASVFMDLIGNLSFLMRKTNFSFKISQYNKFYIIIFQCWIFLNSSNLLKTLFLQKL